MKKRLIFLLFALALMPFNALAQQVDATAYYINDSGIESESKNISDAQAPLTVTFRANPSGMDDYSPSYEWHFMKTSKTETAKELFVRYEEDTEYTFTESGTFHVILKTRLEQDGEELADQTIIITIPESRLEFPNAFSPNDDGINDIFAAKGAKILGDAANSTDGYKSIVKFKAIIVNRWGQKLYEWTDIDGGWDGKHNGTPVKDGVYFVQVTAKGADGKDYHIRKDVNLMRGLGNETGNTTTP